MARVKTASRPQRWETAVADARRALEAVEDAMGDLEIALQELKDMQSEYQDWYDNMPESLQSGPTGEKLSELCNIDITDDPRGSTVDDLTSVLDEAEGVELPRGFGRD